MNRIKKACSIKVDWSQGSTKRALIILPFALIGVGLVIAGNIEGGLAVIGMVQTIYSALGIAVSDAPIPDKDDLSGPDKY